MADLEGFAVLLFGFIVMIAMWRRSWNSQLRDIEPFILVFGALPATFLWVVGMSLAFGSLARDAPDSRSATPPMTATKPLR